MASSAYEGGDGLRVCLVEGGVPSRVGILDVVLRRTGKSRRGRQRAEADRNDRHEHRPYCHHIYPPSVADDANFRPIVAKSRPELNEGDILAGSLVDDKALCQCAPVRCGQGSLPEQRQTGNE
jgi:hypothetical protein